MASAKARSARCLFYLRRAKIIAVIAQKLQNIVSDSLRALGKKQLPQKGGSIAAFCRFIANLFIRRAILVQSPHAASQGKTRRYKRNPLYLA